MWHNLSNRIKYLGTKIFLQYNESRYIEANKIKTATTQHYSYNLIIL